MENNFDYLAVCVNRLKQIRDSSHSEFMVKMECVASGNNMAEAYINHRIWRNLNLLIDEFEQCDENRRTDLDSLIHRMDAVRVNIESMGYNLKPDYFTELVKEKSGKSCADVLAALDMLGVILKGAIGLPNGIVWHGDDNSAETEER